MRYTNEQNNLHDGMIILINLYYKLKETDKEDWLSEPIVRLIGEFAYKVIPTFKKCLYIKSPDHPRLKFYSPKGGVMNLNKKDFRRFVYAMDAFSVEDKEDIISVAGISHEFRRQEYPRLRQKVIENVAIPKAVYRDSENFRFQSFIPGVRDETPGEGHYNGLVSHPIYREIIHFHTYGGSNFVNTLYHSFPVSDKQITPPLKTKRKNNFLDLLQYFFVKYIDVFESFKRIALCDYKPCGKLFYQIHYGKGDYCCDDCGDKNHRAQDPDKYKCRDRQNKWINNVAYRLSRDAYNVSKAYHCDVECELPIEKREVCEHTIGKKKVCPIIYELNEKLCDAYKKIKDNKNHKKERRIDGLELDTRLRKSKRK